MTPRRLEDCPRSPCPAATVATTLQHGDRKTSQLRRRSSIGPSVQALRETESPEWPARSIRGQALAHPPSAQQKTQLPPRPSRPRRPEQAMSKRKQRSGLNLAVYPPALPRPSVTPELPSLLPVLIPTGRISKEYHQLGARRRIEKKAPFFAPPILGVLTTKPLRCHSVPSWAWPNNKLIAINAKRPNPKIEARR